MLKNLIFSCVAYLWQNIMGHLYLEIFTKVLLFAPMVINVTTHVTNAHMCNKSLCNVNKICDDCAFFSVAKKCLTRWMKIADVFGWTYCEMMSNICQVGCLGACVVHFGKFCRYSASKHIQVNLRLKGLVWFSTRASRGIPRGSPMTTAVSWFHSNFIHPNSEIRDEVMMRVERMLINISNFITNPQYVIPKTYVWSWILDLVLPQNHEAEPDLTNRESVFRGESECYLSKRSHVRRRWYVLMRMNLDTTSCRRAVGG